MIYVKKNPKHSCMYKFDPPPGMGGGVGPNLLPKIMILTNFNIHYRFLPKKQLFMLIGF